MKLKITVHGVAYEVEVEVLDQGEELAPAYNFGPVPTYVPPVGNDAVAAASAAPAYAPPKPAANVAAGSGTLSSPVAGTVLEVKCKPGDKVDVGQTVLVIEAMKMHTNIASDVCGTVKKVLVSAEESVREGQALVEFE